MILVRRFLKKLSRKTNKPFKDIPLDRPATYKQRWAVAGKFARECADEYPNKTENGLAAVFNAVILNYHSDPNNSEFTHGDVQSYLDGEKNCPDYYKKLIDIKSKGKSKTKSNSKDKNYSPNNNQVFDLSDEKKVKQFIKLYKEKRTLDQIGKVFGMSNVSVSNYVKRLKAQGIDIDLRGQGARTGTQLLDLSDKDKVQKFIKLHKEGKSYREIGEVFGMSFATASNYAKKLKAQGADIDLRGKGVRTGMQLLDLSDKDKVQQFIKLHKEGKSYKEISEVFGLSTATASNYAKKLKAQGADIDLRGQGGIKSLDLSDKQKVQKFIKFYNEGRSLREIAEAFEMSHGSVKRYINILEQSGEDIKQRDHSNQNSLDLLDKRKVRRFIKLYNEGYSLTQLGDAFGMSSGSVRNYVKRLKERGVDIEFRGQGKRMDTKSSLRRKSISDSIIKDNSSNQALLDLMNTQKRK